MIAENDQGIEVIDQHALHERVMYEQLKKQHAARDVKIQRLLVPTVVEVTQPWPDSDRTKADAMVTRLPNVVLEAMSMGVPGRAGRT